MTNSTVNKIISTIQFTIYSFFAFVLSMLILSYAILSYGINIPRLTLPYFKVEQLYIKLDKKLILHAKRIDVTLGNDIGGTGPLFKLPKLYPIVDMARNNFEYLYIDELNIKDFKVTFRYTSNSPKAEDNKFTLNSDDINTSISFYNYEDYAHLTIDHFIHKPSKVSLSGSSFYNFKEENSYSKLIFSLSKCADVTFYAYESNQEISFAASSNAFSDLAPIIKIFDLPDEIYTWVVPYNKAGSYQLLKATGVYSYTDDTKLLDTLYIHAQEKNLSYTFKKELSPVNGVDADVYFSKGVLDVQPHQATYNEHKIKKGQVLLDFNGDDILLSIDLLLNVRLKQDLVDIVQAYDIPLPLLQKSGKTDAHLKIFINLDEQDAYAIGQFFIKKSELILDGIPYKVENTSIALNKSILSIDTAKIQYKDILKSNLTGQVDLKNVVGDIYFDIKKISLPLSKDTDLVLSSHKPRINLHFTKDTQSFILPDTQWSFNDLNISLAGSEIFTKEKFSPIMFFKDIKFKADDFLDLNASGFYNARDEYGVLDINISALNYLQDDFNLSKSAQDIPLKLIHKNGETRISLLSKSSFFINERSLLIDPTDFVFKDGYLDTKNTIVAYDEEIYSYISTHFKLGSTSIKLQAVNTIIHNHDTLYIQPSFDVLYHYVKKEHYLDIPKYNIHATLNKENEVDMQIRDLQKIQSHSNVLKRYDIKEGKARITYINETIGIDIDILNFHPLLFEDGKDILDYHIKGNYKKGITHLQINKKLDFVYKKNARLSAKNIDFNSFEILNYLERIKSTKKEKPIDLRIKTKKCNINLGKSERKVLADSINIHIQNDNILAQIVHAKGAIMFEGNPKEFIIHAKDLNDNFMNSLFKFSTFSGGKLSFVMEGSSNNLTGVLNIKDTTIENYTVLNNTLAFFNTIPSLITFSVPGYSKNGLKAQDIYASFHKHDDIMDIKEAKIMSKELVITAKGQTDFGKDTIELLMQVKTDFGSSAKQIPIIGYIIFGDDSISTTVRVHGPLQNPIVESSVAKSVIVAPYNILKRTLKMPFQVFGLFKDDNTTK